MFSIKKDIKQAIIEQWPTPTVIDPSIIKIIYNKNYRKQKTGQFYTSCLLNYKFKYGLSAGDLTQLSEKLTNSLNNNLATMFSTFITGNGYLNFKLNNQYIIDSCDNFYHSDNWRLSNLNNHKILIDFGGMNIGKTLHVGHMRSLFIGHALYKLYQYKGYQVVSDIHLGDMGTHIGIIIAEIRTKLLKTFTIKDLEVIYPEGRKKYQSDPSFARFANEIAIMQQNSEILPELSIIKSLSLAYFKDILKIFNIDFTYWLGESDSIPLIPSILSDLSLKGAYIDDGALVIKLQEENILLQKSNGGYLYLTTELATIKYRETQLKVNQIVYVVDKRQTKHFSDTFTIAKKILKYQGNYQLVGFGTINNSEGKPFSTRSGESTELLKLVYKFTDNLKSQYTQADITAVNNFKFSILSHKTNNDFNFNFNQLSVCEGKSGAYIVYTIVRLNALLTKHQYFYSKPILTNSQLLSIDDKIQDTFNFLMTYDDMLEESLANNEIHFIIDYMHLLSLMINNLYEFQHLNQITESHTKSLILYLYMISIKQLKDLSGIIGLTIPLWL